MMYFFYILRCSDNSLYCGITTDVDRRLKEHNSDNIKSAKYTRSRKPVVLVYQQKYPSIKEAMRREAEVKKWKKSKKELLVASVKTASASVLDSNLQQER